MKLDFATLIYNERMRRGWTQGEVAEKAHVSQGVVSAYERGTEPTLSKADRVLRALGLGLRLGKRR